MSLSHYNFKVRIYECVSTYTSRPSLEATTKQRLEFVHTGFYSSASVSMRARISVQLLLICCCNCKRDGGWDKWVDDIWLRPAITTIMHFVRWTLPEARYVASFDTGLWRCVCAGWPPRHDATDLSPCGHTLIKGPLF